jgi:DNA-binding NtrC family response regulator
MSAEKKDSQGHGEKDKRIKLLLVDDEEGYVNVLSNRMGKRNIDVTKALSGTAGIQALRKADFDVAVLDLKMEDMDGIEVLKIFKKMVSDMPVIMLTGHGSEEAARDGIEYGAYDYLIKPCDFDELIEKIREAIQSRR